MKKKTVGSKRSKKKDPDFFLVDREHAERIAQALEMLNLELCSVLPRLPVTR